MSNNYIYNDNNPLIFNQHGGDTMVAGYMLPNTLGLTTTYNGLQEESKPQSGGNIEAVSSLFKGLAVPAGLFLLQQNVGKKPIKNTYESIKKNIIDNDLYETLFSMVSNTDKKKFVRKTRVNRNKKKKQGNKNKKTRKSNRK